MQSLGIIKRGDTFAFSARIVDKVTLLPLTGIASSLECHGRYATDGDLVVSMVVTETATPGVYLFSAPSTDNFTPNETIFFDIQYSSLDIVSSSVTFNLKVEGDFTK